MEDGPVEADRVLPSHKVMDNLQHWAVKGSGVVQTQNIALDPSSNAMYIAECGAGLKPAVLFSATSPHNGHVINEWKGVAMLGVTRDMSDFLKERNRDEQVAQGHVHSELEGV